MPLKNDAGETITTNDNPQGNNTEGNGLTGTSGGEYFVDDPLVINAHGVVPAGATQLRFRYSTDAAYVDTGWFVRDVKVGGAAATLASPDDEWIFTDPSQKNDWSVQVIAPCDMTPKANDEFAKEPGRFVYRLSAVRPSTRCSRAA